LKDTSNKKHGRKIHRQTSKEHDERKPPDTWLKLNDQEPPPVAKTRIAKPLWRNVKDISEQHQATDAKNDECDDARTRHADPTPFVAYQAGS